MANMILQPMNQNARSKRYADKLKVRASYKKDWQKEAREAADTYNANYAKRLDCIRSLAENLK